MDNAYLCVTETHTYALYRLRPARAYAFGNPLGNALTASLVPGRTFDKELEYTIPAEYNIDNCRLVCVITDVSSGEVVNVREVHVK